MPATVDRSGGDGAVSARVERLVELASPYWAAEEAIVAAYFGGEGRTPATDIAWLRGQCYKELWGSGVAEHSGGLFLGPVEYLRESFAALDRGVGRHELLDVIDGLRSEFSHYCLFADVHDHLADPPLDPATLTGWAADEALTAYRDGCRSTAGDLGMYATRFSEGGYGAMYLAGMGLADGDTTDRLIAEACRQVYDEELGHMRVGLADLAALDGRLTDDEWLRLEAMIAEMLRLRLHMRNEQFGFPFEPVPTEMEDGRHEPMPFDHEAFWQHVEHRR